MTSDSAPFKTVTLLFNITQFFSIGYIGEVCSNKYNINVAKFWCSEFPFAFSYHLIIDVIAKTILMIVSTVKA